MDALIAKINQPAAGGASSGGGEGWSKEPIDLAALRLVDADIGFTAGQILYQRIKIGKSVLKTELRGGLLKARLRELALYDGRATGTLTLNGSGKVPAIAAVLTIERISALPLLKDAAAFKWISGIGQMMFNIKGAGATQNALMQSLSGTGNFKFSDGAIEGVNIPKMMRKLTSGSMTGWGKGEAVKTDFSLLTGSYTIRNGIVQNNDLMLVGPLLRMTGKGRINLAQKKLDYGVTPKLVASLEGQGGGADLAGIPIPVRITGPWDRPKFLPDLSKLLENPDQLIKGVGNLGEQIKKLKKGKNVEGLLKGLLGNNSDQGEGKKPNAQDLLKGLFQ